MLLEHKATNKQGTESLKLTSRRWPQREGDRADSDQVAPRKHFVLDTGQRQCEQRQHDNEAPVHNADEDDVDH